MTKLISSLILILIACTSVLGQTRAELEQRRNALLRQIDQNKKTLRDTEKKSEKVLVQAKALSTQIALRQELLSTMTTEIKTLDRSIKSSQQRLERLKGDQNTLLKAQAGQLKSFYIRKKLENPLVFLLSSSNINEALARWQYMTAVSRARNSTLQKVKSQQDSIAYVLSDLTTMRDDKLILAENTVEQERALVQEKREAEKSLASFQARESEIRQLIDKQTRESEKLAREIERVIAAEVEKAEEPAGLPNAPELAALTSEFSGNKGKLPWPIDQGIISGKFGDQPHPIIKSIKISNNGIDFTAPAGERVQAVFTGEVVGKKVIPGFDYMVIIKHGSYYSVYSKLKSTSVEIGDKVKTGQTIGRLANEAGQNAELHLEIWKSKQKLNPTSWIKSR